MQTKTILETERLLLCELREEDSAFIFDLLNSPTWLQFIGDRGIRTPEDALNYITKGPQVSYTNNGFGLYLTKLKTDGTPVGLCGLIKRDTLPNPDIGFAFLPEQEGKGYGYESAYAVLIHARTVLGLGDILAITNTDNQRSVNLLKKLGMRFEKTFRFPNQEQDLFLFASRIDQGGSLDSLSSATT
jgi:RimJ/RimL family protein N-acetyltransferase